MVRGHTELGVVTGKPISLGGSHGRAEATARGCLYALREACRVKNVELKDARIAVHGFGNAGANIARLVAADGAKVIALCDSKAGLYAESGIDVAAAQQASQRPEDVRRVAGLHDVERPAPTRHDLEDALNAVVSGQPIAQASTTAYGCFISDFGR